MSDKPMMTFRESLLVFAILLGGWLGLESIRRHPEPPVLPGPMIITIARPGHLRCGEPSVTNVCRGDVATIDAPRAHTLIVFEDERRQLVCPGDLRCSALGGVHAQLELDHPGEVTILALPGPDPAPGAGCDDTMAAAIPLEHERQWLSVRP